MAFSAHTLNRVNLIVRTSIPIYRFTLKSSHFKGVNKLSRIIKCYTLDDRTF